MLFAEVIIPLPLPNKFTYSVAPDDEPFCVKGSRVVVPFGKQKVLTGLVYDVTNEGPDNYTPKQIISVLDNAPSILPKQLDFFEWMAAYYMCYLGEVIQAAIPSGLKISSESFIQMHPSFDKENIDIQLDKYEEKIVDYLSDKDVVSFAEIASLFPGKSISRTINLLSERRIIVIISEIKEKYAPKKEVFVRISDSYSDKYQLEQLIKTLESKPRQLDILLKYLQMVPIYTQPELNQIGISKRKFVDELDTLENTLKTLIKNEVFIEETRIVSRLDVFENESFTSKEITLSEAQNKAVGEILSSFESKDFVLLHGITGSGKTEVYIHLIQKLLSEDQQVLLLLPEIALTTHIVSRLVKVFGNIIGVYHSKYSDNERVEVWKGVSQKTIKLVVGVRSSIFLPFENLGLIIIDEEHDSSYKQYDPAPRYNARDSALKLAQMHHAKVLLGSATPSVETYYQAAIQKNIGYVTLFSRYNQAQLPEIVYVNASKNKDLSKQKGEFTLALYNEINEALANKEQIILFQNRRGYAPYMCCESCGYVPECINCDVSLTVHLQNRQMVCHYCGHHEKIPNICPKCGSNSIKPSGFGTEKLEEDASNLFRDAKILRMDHDTTRSKHGYQNILNAFTNQEADILVGTQMVTKGLDFENVRLVGIFDIDRVIHFPNFRSNENAFQLLTQVSGRAGRSLKKGKVIVQTNAPNHPIYQLVMNNDHITFYDSEIAERDRFQYPPFTRMIKVIMKHKDQDTLHKFSQLYASELVKQLGRQRILGPEKAIIERIRDYYHMDLYVKLEKEKINQGKAKQLILLSFSKIQSIDLKFKSIIAVFDVDPM
ncbi:MAG: primosomal protein N' [Bacteroidota bacterium]|nr:primosomal protein N' [Bacteroidota bacterium]